jgi:hypothetical protein
VPEIVPWNASWTGEEGLEIRQCRFADGRPAVWQRHAPGTGRPIFANPHFVRQRRSIAEMRCTVCGERTPADNRWWFRHGQELDGHFLTTEAPVHRDCAMRALKVCPHLRGREGELEPMPGGYAVVGAFLNFETVKRDFGLDIMAGQIVIGALKLRWPLSRLRSSR